MNAGGPRYSLDACAAAGWKISKTLKKATTTHGQWLLWLVANEGVLGFSSRKTAAKLMKVASNGALTPHLEADEAAQISCQPLVLALQYSIHALV